MPEPRAKPTSHCDEDFGKCDGCDRLMVEGEPYWGGDRNYWGEANAARCKTCELVEQARSDKLDAHIDLIMGTSAEDALAGRWPKFPG